MRPNAHSLRTYPQAAGTRDGASADFTLMSCHIALCEFGLFVPKMSERSATALNASTPATAVLFLLYLVAGLVPLPLPRVNAAADIAPWAYLTIRRCRRLCRGLLSLDPWTGLCPSAC
jgi:hypothetical protein